MLKINTPFTDCHGIEYIEPVIQIAQANYSSNSHINVGVSGDSNVENHRSVTHNLNYQATIWLDSETKAQGKRPLTLKDVNGNDWHTISLSEPLLNSEAIIEQCHAHILSTIIPQLTKTTT